MITLARQRKQIPFSKRGQKRESATNRCRVCRQDRQWTPAKKKENSSARKDLQHKYFAWQTNVEIKTQMENKLNTNVNCGIYLYIKARFLSSTLVFAMAARPFCQGMEQNGCRKKQIALPDEC